MPDNFARSVQILIELVGNPEARLTEINRLTDQLNNKKIGLTDAVSGLAGGANNAAGALGKVASSTQDVASKASDLSGKSVSAFDKIKSSVLDLNTGVQTLAASLAGIAMGGAISGLTWKASAESTLYVEQIERAINSNKKLKISFAELEEFSKQQAEAGQGTRRANIKEYYSILMAGSKYIKGSSTEKLAKADYITDFWFANQELMKAQGFGSAEDLVRSSVRTTGKLTGTRRDALATALGVDPEGKEMSSAKSRMKYMMEMGKDVNMSEALSKRPWEGFATSLKSLKDSIGDSLVWPMNKFVQLLTGAVKLLNSIPGAGLFIGLAGGAIALVSTLTLLNGVLSPGLALLKEMVLWTNLHTAAEVKQMVVSKALIVTDWLGLTSKAARTNAIIAETVATAAAASATALNTGAIGMESVALEIDAVANLNTTGAIFGTTAARTAAIGPTMGLTGATTSLAAAEWAALSPLLLLAIPLIAIAGLLYLVETRTHVFSNALDKLSKTEMSKDLIQWLEDVGYWAGYAIDRLGSVIESDLFSKIDSLNSAYTNVKSGNILGILGLGNEKSSETKPSATSQLLGLDNEKSSETKPSTTSQLLGSVGGLPGTNLLTMTKIVTPLSLMQNHLEFIVNVLSWFENFFSGGNPLTNIYNAIIRLPANIYKTISERVSKQIEKVTTKFSEITKFFGDINTELSTKFGEITSDISTKYNEITTSVSNWFSEITSTITTKYNELLTNASTKFGEITSDISTKFNEIITTITTKITDIITTITTKFEGITTTITTKFDDIITSIKSMLPGDIKSMLPGGIKSRLPGGSSGGTSDSSGEQETSSTTTKLGVDAAGNPLPFDPNLYYASKDSGKITKGSDILKQWGDASNKARDLYKNEAYSSPSGKSSGSNNNNNNNKNSKTEVGGKYNPSISVPSTMSAENKAGYAKLADSQEYAPGSGYANGGLVTKSGIALVHEGEPIIPADVASSSRLQNILESIAYGGSSSNTYGDKFEEIITTITTKITDIISTITTKFEGITTTITTKFNDIITSIKSMLPGWMKGSDSGNAAGGSEEGFIKFIRETKKGSENYFKYGQLSDETLRAAYREGLTGVPQEHENFSNTKAKYEYDNIVKNAVPEYTKSIQNNTTFNTTNNINTLGDLGAAADKTLQDDIAKIKEKVDSGEPISSLTPDLGNPSGLAKIAYTGLDSASGGRISSAVDSGKEALGSGWNALRDTVGFADGGFVQKTGFALVHEGEPIIPADVASSSRLQNILESIAYGGSSSNTYGDINVRINYTPPSSSTSSNMIVMDRISFEHMVSDIIAKRLRQLNGY